MRNKIKLAVADDHLLFRQGIIGLLNRNDDFELIAEASNGKELLEKLSLERPDIILLDLDMPVLDGAETQRKLKEEFPEVKTIILSMYDEISHIGYMFELGVNGYLLKNAEIEEVEKAIYTLTEKEFYFNWEASKAMQKRLASKKRQVPKINGKIGISIREQEVLELICKQYSTNEIADALFLSARTIESYRKNLLEKTNSKNIVGLVWYAIENGLAGDLD